MIDSDKPGIHERLLAAFQATDLSIDPERRTAADLLAALGMAESHVGRANGSAMRLMLTGGRADYRSARESVIEMVKRLSAKHNWRLSGQTAKVVGELALAHHVFPACPECHGRAREQINGAFLGNICKPCHGTGKRPIQRKNREEIKAVLATLERIEELTEYHVRRILR